jgi:hypothetical protein
MSGALPPPLMPLWRLQCQLCKRKTSFLLLELRFFDAMAAGTQNTNSGELFIYRVAERAHEIRCITFSSGIDDD